MRSILRQIVAVLALVGIVTTMVPATFAVTYTAQAAADKLAASNFIVDQSATPAAYRLADNLLRQEAVGTAATVLGVLNVPLNEYVCQNRFTDVSAASGWVCRAAELAAAAGVTNAANSSFRPKDNLTRYEALVFALRAAGLVPSAPQTQESLIQLGADNGLITSSAGFNANASATRGEFFQYTTRGLDAAESPELCDILGICPDNNGGGTYNGPISLSLATSQPSGVIVAGQATAPLLAVKVSGTGTLQTLTLKRSGISDQNTLSNVYLYDGASRLTDGYSFNNSSELTMNNLGLAISGSRTIWVLADVLSSASSGQTIAVSVTGVRANAETTVSSANVMGNLFSVASGSTLASVVNTAAANVTAATVNAGTSSYAIWRQSFNVNTRTMHLKAANFRISGSAPADALANIGLYVDGVKVGNNATMTMANGSNYISFDLYAAPKELTTGSHTVEVRADIVKGSSYNFTVALQQASDIMIMDPQVGVNIVLCGTTGGTVCASGTANSFSSLTGGQISIGAGSATAVIDPTFNTFTNITGGSSNATIAKFKLRGYGEDVKVTALSVLPILAGTTPAAAGLQNVTLYFNGSQVGSQQNWTSGNLSFNLGSQLIIPAGVDSFLEVRADLRTTGGANYTAGTISANIPTGGTAEGQNSKSSVTFPSAIVSGNTLTIQTGLLAVAKNAGYANQTQNPNTAGVKIGSFVLQNQSSSEGVRVTSLAVGIGGTSLLTNLSGLKTSETSGSGATPVQPQLTNTFSVDFTLAAGATKTIDIFADTSSGTGTVIPTLTVTGIGSSSNTTVSPALVTGQTITLSAGIVATPTLTTSSSTQQQFIAAAGGASDASKATYKFVSTGGASTITELKFNVNTAPGGVGTALTPVTSVKVGSVSAPVVGGVAWLQGLNIAVPNGGSGLSIDVMLSYSDVGTSGEAPGSTAITSLNYVKYSSGGTTAVLSGLAVDAPTMTLVGSKPTISVDGTVKSGLNVAAVSKIGEVTVSADAKGSIKVNDIVFTVGSSGFTTAPTGLASITIRDGSTTISGSSCAAAFPTVTCEFGTAGNGDFDGYEIAAGTSKTFSLYADITGEDASGSGTPTISTSVVQATFNWDDTSTNGTSGTGLTGANIYNFPTTSYSVKQ